VLVPDAFARFDNRMFDLIDIAVEQIDAGRADGNPGAAIDPSAPIVKAGDNRLTLAGDVSDDAADFVDVERRDLRVIDADVDSGIRARRAERMGTAEDNGADEANGTETGNHVFDEAPL